MLRNAQHASLSQLAVHVRGVFQKGTLATVPIAQSTAALALAEMKRFRNSVLRLAELLAAKKTTALNVEKQPNRSLRLRQNC